MSHLSWESDTDIQACGLRWAKRNSTAPSRKEKKLLAEAKKQ
jgi:hypothetical protein